MLGISMKLIPAEYIAIFLYTYSPFQLKKTIRLGIGCMIN